MTRPLKLLLVGSVAVLAVAFFGIATAGWLRERQDEELKREEYQRLEASLRERIEQVRHGVSLEAFKATFPTAFQEDGDTWSVWIPVGYNESPSCENHTYEEACFKVDGDKVTLADDMKKRGIKHIDKFQSGTPWYYFLRAFRSSEEP